MANGLLCGEKNTLVILLGSNTQWGERYFAEVDGNSAGDTIVTLEVLIDFAGDRKTSTRTIFP